MKKRALPSEALWFRAGFEIAADSKNPDSLTRSFSGIAYSGDAIRHPFWSEPIIFDLASTSFLPKIPALIDHDRAKRAGFAELAKDGNQLTARGNLLSNAFGSEVAKDADEGFPWQMSVHIEPEDFGSIEAGEEAHLNGRIIPGPAVIFRNSTIREVSFTPTGVDWNTSAHVMSSGNPINIHIEEQEKMSEKNEALQAKVTTLEEQVSRLQASLDAEKQRADEAEKKLSDSLKEIRAGEIAALEQATGRTFSDEDKAMLFNLDPRAFTFMSAQMKARPETETTKQKLNPQLFQHPGTAPPAPDSNPLLEDAKKRFSLGG